MKLRLDDLRCVVLPGENCPDFLRADYQSAYKMWKQVWTDAFNEIGKPGIQSSDAFTKQHRICALFKGADCVALVFMRPVDFRDETPSEDSYFQLWPKESIAKLIEDGPKVVQCTNLTVASGYRGEVAPGILLKVLIIQLGVRYFLTTDASVMTGAMRINKGAHTAAYAAGATLISTGTKGYDVMDLDLVGFYRRSFEKDPSPVTSLWVTKLWDRRIEPESQPDSLPQTTTKAS